MDDIPNWAGWIIVWGLAGLAFLLMSAYFWVSKKAETSRIWWVVLVIWTIGILIKVTVLLLRSPAAVP